VIDMKRKILATGGAGYIGSHVAVALLEAGHDVVILDNFENSDPSVLNRIEHIAQAKVTLVEGDVRDRATLDMLFRRHRIDAVIHLAGKKAVGESVADPLLYFHDNIAGAVALLQSMQAAQVDNLVFSSSATVYGVPEQLPIDESCKTGVTSPYGRTKLMIEEILDDCVTANSNLNVISLRYFNPVGAHHSHLIGENPKGIPNNLFPYVAQTALGERPYVQVFGSDYDTHDGTGLRDYIHVVDLAAGHLAAINFVLNIAQTGIRHRRINLGTGNGHTVLDVIEAFSRACGFPVPYQLAARRPGDAAASVADASLAHKLLGWKAELGLDRMCADQWAFGTKIADRKAPAPAARAKTPRFNLGQFRFKLPVSWMP
jgi:UDP-glucose 4-epimerase